MPYTYVGPAELTARIAVERPGTPLCTADDLHTWWRAQGTDEIVVTFVVATDGTLRIADRHSEHVVCASGRAVLTAGELTLRGDGDAVEVVETSNQSTGYCPEVASWPPLQAALDALGVAHPGGWTAAFEFRRCERCGETNIVKDDWYVCALCGAELPGEWNYR